jgi:hypothetical protein
LRSRANLMLNAARAALAAVLLLGFYVYAFGVVAALGVLTLVLVDRVPGAVAGKLGYLTLALAGNMPYATRKLLRVKPMPLPGLVLTQQRTPLLWLRFVQSPSRSAQACPMRCG